MSTINKAEQYKQDMLKNARKQLSIANVLTYGLMGVGLFGLGLLNWAELSFDLEAITIAYLITYILQIFSYGSIIASQSTNQLHKLKKTSVELSEIRAYIDFILRYYRPEQLSNFVYKENLKTRRELYIKRYKEKLAKLEKKNNNFKKQTTWLDFVELKKKNKDAYTKPPNRYCLKKTQYLDKLADVDKYYKEEHIEFDELKNDDLILGLSNSGSQGIPRDSEGLALGGGIARATFIMGIGGLIISIIIINFTRAGLDGIIGAFLTVFFVLLSAFKGLMNGERVYENVTLRKLKFQQSKLHGYAMYEATENGYVIKDETYDTLEIK